MPSCKPAQRSGMFIPVVFEEQIQPGTFEFALRHLVDDELDLSALDAKFRNDATGASAVSAAARDLPDLGMTLRLRTAMANFYIKRTCVRQAAYVKLYARQPAPNPAREIPEKTNARRLLPLWRGSTDASCNSRGRNRLQLLAVPPHWRSMGVLRVRHREDRGPSRGHC